jgi:very-short-patch-repair endonuclease
MKHYIQHYHAQMNTRDLAKDLRRTLTPAEHRFWFYVRNKKMLGLKFRRQHPIANFIADFYCHELKLIVEIDGGIHHRAEAKKYDAFRTSKIKELGLTVLRFSNSDVFYNIDGVEREIQKIKEAC